MNNSYHNHCYLPLGAPILRTVNFTSQTGFATTATKLNLGTSDFDQGNSIYYCPPNTIHFKPGLYAIEYAGDFTGNTTGDIILLKPMVNNIYVPGSSLSISCIAGTISHSAKQSFLVSVSNLSILEFEATATSTSDMINDFTVTVKFVA